MRTYVGTVAGVDPGSLEASRLPPNPLWFGHGGHRVRGLGTLCEMLVFSLGGTDEPQCEIQQMFKFTMSLLFGNSPTFPRPTQYIFMFPQRIHPTLF